MVVHRRRRIQHRQRLVQWRTQKMFMERVVLVQCHMVFCIWCALFVTSFPCFQTNVLATSVDIIGIFFDTHNPYFMCHCT